MLAADSSTLSTVAYAPDSADDLTDKDSILRQFVSTPLKAQTISGNLTGQFQCLETLANDNLKLTVKVMVCNNAGSSILATLLAITRATSEVSTSLRNVTFQSAALSSYACADNDRLVIEVGLGGNITSGTGGTVGHNGSIRFGCNASSGDLPVDETTTGTTYRPWMEFSNTIKWLAESDGSSTGTGASSTIGAALWAGVVAAAGVAASTVVGALLVLSIAASDGVASESVTSAVLVPGDGSSIGLATALADGEAASDGSTGAADGTATASANSGEIHARAGDASGAAESTVTASSFVQATGASDGVASEIGVGAAIQEANAVSAGVAVASTDGAAFVLGTADSAGIADITGAASSFWQADLSADGQATAVAESSATQNAEASAAGSATVLADSQAVGSDPDPPLLWTTETTTLAGVSGETTTLAGVSGETTTLAGVSGETLLA